MRYIGWICWCVLLTVVTACTREAGESPSPAPGDGWTQVGFTLADPSMNYSTRSEGNTVREIDLLVFNVSGGDEYFSHRSSIGSYNVGEKGITFQAKLLIGDLPQRIVFFANSSDKIDALGTLSGTDKKDDILARLTDGNNAPLDTESLIPMWGETGNTYTISESTVTIPEKVGLLRMMARIDVAISGAVGSDVFRLTDVYLYTPVTSGTLVPSAGNWDAAQNRVTAPTVPAGATVSPTPFHYPVGSGNAFGNIYTYEKPYTDDPAQAIFLIIKGYYRRGSEPSFYRIDVLREKDGVNPAGLLRNHLYRMTVTGVGGPGAKDATTALLGENAQLAVEYEVWDQGDLDLWFDGRNILVAGDAHWKVSRAAKQYTTTVYTDVPQGWTASVTGGGDWLTIISPLPAQGIAGTKTDLVFGVGYNATGGERTGVITLTAGDLTGEITVVQTLSESILSVSIVDQAGDPLDEITYLSGPGNLSGEPRNFTVDWTPKTAMLISEPSGEPGFTFGEGSDTPGGGSSGFGGSHTFTVFPTPFTVYEIAGKNYVEKATDLIFWVVDGDEYVTRKLTLRHIYSM